MIVQWNCHPESMGSRNTLLTADFTTPALPRSGHEVVQFNTQMS